MACSFFKVGFKKQEVSMNNIDLYLIICQILQQKLTIVNSSFWNI